MTADHDRRGFLKSVAAAGAAAGLSDLSFSGRLAARVGRRSAAAARRRPVAAGDRAAGPAAGGHAAGSLAGRSRGPRSHRFDVPRRAGRPAAWPACGTSSRVPSVGFKFHAVLAVNSVHLAAMASPETERWLPLFWGLDYFKDSQARDVQEGNWTMRPVDEAAVPPADKARAAFVAAMDDWDEPAADAAVAGLARTAPAKEIFELFYRYGARDFRSIGHKAIFVAGAERALQFIGWQHAEPVLRSLAYALLMHEEGNPAQRDAEADRPWRQHPALVKRLPGDLGSDKIDAGATRDLLAVLRSESYEAAAAKVVEVLNGGVARAVGLGRHLLRRRRTVAAPARHRLLAFRDDDQCLALRLPSQRQP